MPGRELKLGILGGGQLGRMLAMAAAPLGIRCRVFEPESQPPAAIVAEVIRGRYDDVRALETFAQGLDAVTFEFENVPPMALDAVSSCAPVWPPPSALQIAQDRLKEKQFFRQLGVRTADFAAVDNLHQLKDAAAMLGYPAILKTRRLGYDGKGQVVIKDSTQLEEALETLGSKGLILEAFVRFSRELSVIGVRAKDGTVQFYDLPQNTHEGGILRSSLAPAPHLAASVTTAAQAVLSKAMHELDYVGVLAIELFLDSDNQLIVNEMAPRVHNSGHWTIEGSTTSQFENHVRAVLGLPLGCTASRGHSVMLNLIGNEPNRQALLSHPDVKLHLYGKAAKPGRKLGHATLVQASSEAAHLGLKELSGLIGGAP